jgi:hypothetical protein
MAVDVCRFAHSDSRPLDGRYDFGCEAVYLGIATFRDISLTARGSIVVKHYATNRKVAGSRPYEMKDLYQFA